MSQRGRGDPEVVRADRATARLQLCPDVGVDPGDALGHRDGGELGEEVLDKCTTLVTSRASGAVNTVQQFADGDHADRTASTCRLATPRSRSISIEVSIRTAMRPQAPVVTHERDRDRRRIVRRRVARST
jgi:hypothetical protein